MVKRVFDFSVSLFVLAASLPLFILIGLAVGLDSPGPIIFKQVRLGKNNRPFTIYKFRTVDNNLKTKNNSSRQTKVGKRLKFLMMDELPQLLNILKGEMSLVGPRPELLELAGDFAKGLAQYNQRHLVKPGLTGWAQVHGWRSDRDAKEQLRHDLYYINNLSFALDAKILIRTANMFCQMVIKYFSPLRFVKL